MPDILDLLFPISRILNGFRVLLNPLFPPFSRFERQVLQVIESKVRDEYRENFKEHLTLINFVQRDGGNRRIRMYSWVFPGRYNWKRTKLFEGRNLAKFRVNLADGSSFGGSLYSVDGIICNLTFGKDIKALADSVLDIEVIGGTICSN